MARTRRSTSRLVLLTCFGNLLDVVASDPGFPVVSEGWAGQRENVVLARCLVCLWSLAVDLRLGDADHNLELACSRGLLRLIRAERPLVHDS